jgi:small subunit ribosomal protein S21
MARSVRSGVKGRSARTFLSRTTLGKPVRACYHASLGESRHRRFRAVLCILAPAIDPPSGVVRGVSEPGAIAAPNLGRRERRADVQVQVRDNNVDQALRALKKKMQREGIFREMKLRRNYEKPSEKRARERAEAVRRSRKLLRKRMEREGY